MVSSFGIENRGFSLVLVYWEHSARLTIAVLLEEGVRSKLVGRTWCSIIDICLIYIFLLTICLYMSILFCSTCFSFCVPITFWMCSEEKACICWSGGSMRVKCAVCCRVRSRAESLWLMSLEWVDEPQRNRRHVLFACVQILPGTVILFVAIRVILENKFIQASLKAKCLSAVKKEHNYIFGYHESLESLFIAEFVV